MTSVPLAHPPPPQNTSIRIHISAPSSRKDDDRYRGIACAYERFTPAKRVQVVELGRNAVEQGVAGYGTSANDGTDKIGAHSTYDDPSARENVFAEPGEKTGDFESRNAAPASQEPAPSLERGSPGQLRQCLVSGHDEPLADPSEQPGSPTRLSPVLSPQHSCAPFMTPAMLPKRLSAHGKSATAVAPPPLFVDDTPLAAELAESQILTRSLRRKFEIAGEEQGADDKSVGDTDRVRKRRKIGDDSGCGERDGTPKGLTSSPPVGAGGTVDEDEEEDDISPVGTPGSVSLEAKEDSQPQHRHYPRHRETEVNTTEDPQLLPQLPSSPYPFPPSSAPTFPPSSPNPSTTTAPKTPTLPTEPTHIFPPSASSSQNDTTAATPTPLPQDPTKRTPYHRLTRQTRNLSPHERGCWTIHLTARGWSDPPTHTSTSSELHAPPATSSKNRASFWTDLARFVEGGRAGWDVTLGIENVDEVDGVDGVGEKWVRMYCPAGKVEWCFGMLWVFSGSRVGRLRSCGGETAADLSVDNEVREGPHLPSVRWEDDCGIPVVWVEPDG